MLRFVACCQAAGPSSPGHYVDADAPVSPRAGPVSEPLPEREFVPSLACASTRPRMRYTCTLEVIALTARKSGVETLWRARPARERG